MKKISIILVTICALLTLCACSDKVNTKNKILIINNDNKINEHTKEIITEAFTKSINNAHIKTEISLNRFGSIIRK